MDERELLAEVRKEWENPTDNPVRIELDDHRIVYGGSCGPMDADLDYAVDDGLGLDLSLLLSGTMRTLITKNGDHYYGWVIRWKIQYVADNIIANNRPYYGADLLNLIPTDLINAEVNDNNSCGLSIIIDQLRFHQENEAAELLGYKAGWGTEPTSVCEFARIINSTSTEYASSITEHRARRIRFLLDLGATIVNLHPS